MKPILTLYDNGTWAYADANAPAPMPPGQSAPAITSMPQPYAELPDNGFLVEKQVAPGEVVGFRFVTRSGTYHRQIDSAGRPQFCTRMSWAIFDAGGQRVTGEDNVEYGGGGIKVEPSLLNGFGAGPFTFAVATNGSGNLGTRFNQQ